MRDVTTIGHFGPGDLEYPLTSPGQLAQVARSPDPDRPYTQKAQPYLTGLGPVSR